MAAKKRSGELASALAAVTDDEVNERSNEKIDVLVADAKRMSKFAEGWTRQLAKLPGLSASLVTLIGALADGLADAELEWNQSRKSVLGGVRARQRAELKALRSRVLATARFALRLDAKASARLAAIAEGDGTLADLLSDAAALARELRGNPALATLDPKLKGGAEKLDELAATLSDAPTGADGDLMRVRNRYAVALSSAMTELEAGLDFLLRDFPAKRRQYARTPRRAAVHSRPATGI